MIKALFLNSSNFKDTDLDKLRLKQLEIASEWDRIEYSLQDNSFWLFLNKENDDLPTRIEFVFHLMYQLEREKYSDKSERVEFNKMYGNDNYSTFRFFNHKFNLKEDNVEKKVNQTWLKIKKLYQTLEEWYDDRELYHKVGYLITVGVDIKEIIKAWRRETKDDLKLKEKNPESNNKPGRSKEEFKKWIDVSIKTEINRKIISLDKLVYGDDNMQIIHVLLLHNIITTLKADNKSLLFPFDSYKDKTKGGWSIEHIHAQNSKEITEVTDFVNWLNEVNREYLKGYETSIENAKNGKEKIQDVINNISLQFGDVDIHTIDNLALLMRDDNSKLSNGIFLVKRELIIKLEQNGAFIPVCTRKVFQKFYKGSSQQITEWGEADRDAYLSDIKDKLSDYKL